ncbi:MAG: Ion transport 2 domain protein [Nitrospira sp.]|nr:Ion transport 2 domain protein [Nitrospira sp.]
MSGLSARSIEGCRALGAGMERRGFAYVLTLTLLVTLTGAAGMYVFERNIALQEPPSANPLSHGMKDYGAALWWTVMIMTTMGSDYWPRTPEGRVLCVLLALYAFAMFGYLTATLASYFIGRDAVNDQAEIAGAASIDRLQKDVNSLRDELRTVAQKMNRSLNETPERLP